MYVQIPTSVFYFIAGALTVVVGFIILSIWASKKGRK